MAPRSVNAARELGVFTIRRELYPAELVKLREIWGPDYGQGVTLWLEAEMPKHRNATPAEIAAQRESWARSCVGQPGDRQAMQHLRGMGAGQSKSARPARG